MKWHNLHNLQVPTCRTCLFAEPAVNCCLQGIMGQVTWIQVTPPSLQALNNWGLVLQELTALRPASEREFLVSAAAVKFRRAIRLRPEFDRGQLRLASALSNGTY
jgi:hypothetical protein